MAKEIIMPRFGMTQEEATIVEWLVKEGDYVDQDDPIAEVTTDKVNMEVEAPASGYLGGLRYAEGDTVPVTVIIGYILEEGEEAPAPSAAEAVPTAQVGDGSTLEAAAPPPQAAAPVAVPVGPTTATPVARRMAEAEGVDLTQIDGSGPGGKVTRDDVERALTGEDVSTNGHSQNGIIHDGPLRATPAARRAAREQGVDLAMVAGSGPAGRVQEADVYGAAEQLTIQPAAQEVVPSAQAARIMPAYVPTLPAQLPEGAEITPLDGMRRTIATRLQSSYQQAPHIYLTLDIDMTEAIAFRKYANEQATEDGQRISMTAVIAKAVAWALRENPAMNSHFYETDEGGAIVAMPQVNLGIAVALDDGLIVPVIADADQKGLRQLGAQVSDVAGRARQGRLRPSDMSGGTFTISNLGMFGISHFTAILNPPEVGILAVGQTEYRFVPDDDGMPVARPMMTVTLSADHRVIDGAQGAHFLQTLQKALQQPATILL